jgi:hypothetical protein
MTAVTDASRAVVDSTVSPNEPPITLRRDGDRIRRAIRQVLDRL